MRKATIKVNRVLDEIMRTTLRASAQPINKAENQALYLYINQTKNRESSCKLTPDKYCIHRRNNCLNLFSSSLNERIAGGSEVINKIFYGLAVLLMILVIAWGGSWLYQAIFKQFAKIIS